MAEPFSIATSAIQVAGAGLSLAKTLHAYIEEVKSAQKHIKAVAVEVKLTASVLEHLGALLKENEAERLCTTNVVSDAKDALSGCKDAFNEIEEAFKAIVRVQADGKRTVSATARFAWPFKKGKLEALQANLERLKSTLLLMLSVLSYAREKAARPTELLSLQRVQIQNLIKAKDDATMRYEGMLIEMKKLETTDKDTIPPQPISQGASSPWLNLHAAGRQPSMTPPVHPKDTADLMDQLVRCTSAISSLAASVSAAMVSHSAGNGIEAPEIERNFSQVKQVIASLVTPRPQLPPASSTGNVRAGLGMMNVQLRASCDAYNESMVRCSQATPICARCERQGITCVYDLSRRRHGAAPRVGESSQQPSAPFGQTMGNRPSRDQQAQQVQQYDALRQQQQQHQSPMMQHPLKGFSFADESNLERQPEGKAVDENDSVAFKRDEPPPPIAPGSASLETPDENYRTSPLFNDNVDMNDSHRQRFTLFPEEESTPAAPRSLKEESPLPTAIPVRKRAKPLPPIMVDENDTVALKRARNTAAARKARAKKDDERDILKAEIADLKAQLETNDQSRTAVHRKASPQPAEQSNPALQEFQMQLTLLEDQNKKRLLMAKTESENAAQIRPWTDPYAQIDDGASWQSVPQPTVRQQSPSRPVEARAHFLGRGGFGHVSKKRVRPSQAAEEEASELTSGEKKAKPAKSVMEEMLPDCQNEQQKQVPMSDAPFGSLDDQRFPDMNLDFTLEGGDVLDDFDFDPFLNPDERSFGFDAALAFGEGQRSRLTATVDGKESMDLESLSDSVDEVEELVKRWTTVEV